MVSNVLMEVSNLWGGTVPVEVGGITFWRNKHMRTELAVALFESYLGFPVNEKTWKLCLLMDSIINSADDIADYTPVIPRENLLRSEILGYISWTLFIRELENSLPAKQRKEFLNSLFDYSLKLSRIPIVERDSLEKILSARTREEEMQTATECYLYRAVDIDIFVSLIGISLNLDGTLFSRIRKVARYMRAYAILDKDIADLEFDVKTGANTPLVAFLEKYGAVESYIKEIRSKIYGPFLEFADENALKLWGIIFNNESLSQKITKNNTPQRDVQKP